MMHVVHIIPLSGLHPPLLENAVPKSHFQYVPPHSSSCGGGGSIYTQKIT